MEECPHGQHSPGLGLRKDYDYCPGYRGMSQLLSEPAAIIINVRNLLWKIYVDLRESKLYEESHHLHTKFWLGNLHVKYHLKVGGSVNGGDRTILNTLT
jgi:hypothetical protein